MSEGFSGWRSKDIELSPLEREPLRILRFGGFGWDRPVPPHNQTLIPYAMADALKRPDLQDMVRLHALEGEGECNSVIGRLEDDTLVLLLEFTAPARLKIIIRLEPERHALLIDGILETEFLFLIVGEPDLEIDRDSLAKAIIINVPDTGFSEEWRKIRPEGNWRVSLERL